MATTCKICGIKTTAGITTTEKRYFHGEQAVCKPCFDLLASNHYLELDKRAMAKILPSGASQ